MSTDIILPLDAFIRSVSINRNTPHCLFLGAGASVSSRIPSAERCTLEWKGKIFTSANPGLENQIAHLTLPSTQRIIQSWIDKQPQFPELNDPAEYGFFIEYCYPLADDRRAYFNSLVRTATPSFGYRLLPILAEAGMFDSVWTTNFDGLAARATVGTAVTAIEVGLDTVSRIYRLPRKNELLCVALHGDYRYGTLKNTTNEIQEQDITLRNELVKHLRDRTLIIVGYSGRDQSIMDSLTSAVETSGVGRLFWCGFQQEIPPLAVKELLERARSAGRQAFYVNSQGFDDIMRRLSLQCLDGSHAEKAISILSASDSAGVENNKPFSLPNGQPAALVKSNCFPLECPSEIYEFEVPDLCKEGAWAALRESLKGHAIAAGILRKNVVAIGLLDDIKATFQNRIKGDITRCPIADHELDLPNGVIAGVLRQSLVRGLAKLVDLNTDGDELLWEKTPFLTQEVYRWHCIAYRAVVVSLKRARGRQFLALMPTVVGKPQRGTCDLPVHVEKELKRKILSTQFNKEFSDVLDYWRKKLFTGDETSIEYPAGQGSSFKFRVKSVPAFARIDAARPRSALSIPNKYLHLLQFEGLRLPEPKLRFISKDGVSIASDDHPIRGLVTNRPFDFALTAKGIDTDVRLGVICPRQEQDQLTAFLGKLGNRVNANSKKGYLIDYPGFAQAFGLPLEVPQTINQRWVYCPEPEGTNDKERALSLVKNVRACVDQIVSSTSTRLVLIFIPRRWSSFADYEGDDEEINAHDLLKAYCVQRGIASQFLREATLAKRFDCEVMWWLALSLYAKSMRMPWILAGTSPTTAFVGIGFGVLRHPTPQGHVVLGCSHIYSADGLGLHYRLSKIENPILIHRNPHLSVDDALRLAEDVRQLFFESRGRLPERIVIHKRTPFLKTEREGLLRGLRDVPQVDLVEINVEPTIRCIASFNTPSGFSVDTAPLDRGTAILFDRFKFLLWVNGNARPSASGENYYMGKFRIPAPVLVKKHWGPSNLETLADEILALSKMNWNTFDLYTRLPATIHSSNEIARIGKLLQRFERESYDYRLFI